MIKMPCSSRSTLTIIRRPLGLHGIHSSTEATVTYRADWDPAAASGRRALGVFWRCPAALWGLSTPNPTHISWEILVLKNWPIFLCHVDMWWIGPMWPKCAFGNQKGLIRNKGMPFGNPPYHGKKNLQTLKSIFFYLYGSKVVFLVKNCIFGWFGLSVR